MKSSIKKYRYINNVCGTYGTSYLRYLSLHFPYMGNAHLWRTITKYTVTIKWKVLNSHWIICHFNVLVPNDMGSVCESSEVDQVKPIEKEVRHTNTWWTDNSFITFIQKTSWYLKCLILDGILEVLPVTHEANKKIILRCI